MQAGQFQCVVPAIHSLEATKRPTLSLIKPVIGRLEQKFDRLSKISYRLNGEKKVILCNEVHPTVMDARQIFLQDLRTRFMERIGHEEDILVATALDPRYNSSTLYFV